MKLSNPLYYLILIFSFLRQGSGGILSYSPILQNPDYRIVRSKDIVKEFKISTVHGLGMNCRALEDLMSNQQCKDYNQFILRLGNTLVSLPN